MNYTLLFLASWSSARTISHLPSPVFRPLYFIKLVTFLYCGEAPAAIKICFAETRPIFNITNSCALFKWTEQNWCQRGVWQESGFKLKQMSRMMRMHVAGFCHVYAPVQASILVNDSVLRFSLRMSAEIFFFPLLSLWRCILIFISHYFPSFASVFSHDGVNNFCKLGFESLPFSFFFFLSKIQNIVLFFVVLFLLKWKEGKKNEFFFCWTLSSGMINSEIRH